MWIPPKKNWNVNDIVTAQDMNAIGEDLDYLYQTGARAAATINATSTNGTASFATLVQVNVTTRGGALLVGFYGAESHDASGSAYYDVAVDGTRKALNGFSGSLETQPGSTPGPVCMTLLLTGIGAGAHTLSLQWRTSAQWLSMGVGQFWLVEV
jgi:hypothetical protein